MHNDLLLALEKYSAQGYNCSVPIAEKESIEYCAYEFCINKFKVKYRRAKVTPTKIGLFVTLWKRINNGPIQPFDSNDDIDFFIVSVRKEQNFGQFIFPKNILIEQKIISDQKEGKRAIRVYPPWEKSLNKQAQKTQNWQLSYFFEFNNSSTIKI